MSGLSQAIDRRTWMHLPVIMPQTQMVVNYWRLHVPADTLHASGIIRREGSWRWPIVPVLGHLTEDSFHRRLTTALSPRMLGHRG